MEHFLSAKIIPGLVTAMITAALGVPALAASSPTRVTIHVPSKSLSIMPYYFGKDKGFFAPDQIEPQLVLMSPPTRRSASHWMR